LRIIRENIVKLSNNDLSGSDELLYNKEAYEVLEDFDAFRINLSMNLQALRRSSVYYQDEIMRLQNKISQTSVQLDRVNLGLDNSLANATQYQNLTGNVNKVSDGIDLLTTNFDSALNGIDEISSIVNSIGKQTTMLALNAGIEAARAGEYGRGFEVVASNLRRLAQHAVKSSNDITNMSKEINTNAKEALEAITQGMGTLRRNLDQDHNLILEYNTTIYNTVLQLNNIIAENRALTQRIEENTNFLDNYEY
jgi:methyl-accepting chemotaxis protein